MDVVELRLSPEAKYLGSDSGQENCLEMKRRFQIKF